MPDDYWISQSDKEAVEFINANTSAQDYVFVFNNEGLFYYLLKAKSPTRFTNIYIADVEFFRQEVLADLKRNQPKYVIYTTGRSSEALNSMPMKSRFLEVDRWILENYPKKIKFDQILVLAE